MSTDTDKILASICRFLDAIHNDSFGDATDSHGDTVPVAAEWTPILSTSRASLVQLFNPGALLTNIWLSATGAPTDIGGILPGQGFTVWDRFEGSVYARGPVGSTLNFFVLPRRFVR